MSFFDSPIARCDAVRELVLVDQTQAQCALEHDCPQDRVCPLCGYFAAPEDVPDEILAAHSCRVAVAKRLHRH